MIDFLTVVPRHNSLVKLLFFTLFFLSLNWLFFTLKVFASPLFQEVDVQIQGVEGAELDNVKAGLSLLDPKETSKMNSEWLRYLYKKAPQEIKSSLEPFGYFNTEVDSSLERKDGNKWLASFFIKKGSKVKISKTDIKVFGPGDNETSIAEILKRQPFKTGDFFDQDEYEKFKRDIIIKALSIGYAGVKASESRVMVDPEDNSASITLHFNTGPLYSIGKITVEQDIISDGLVNRYLQLIKPGEQYSQKKLILLQQNLINSGYFSKVFVTPRFDMSVDDKVPVDVRLYPSKKHEFSIGAGYDTLIGPNGMVRWQNRRINSYGHRSDVLLRLSMPKSSLKTNYWIPGFDPVSDKLGFGAKGEREVTDNTERITFDIDSGYYFTWKKLLSRVFTEIKIERFRTDSTSWTQTKLLSAGGAIQFSDFPSEPFPLSGWSVDTEFRGSPGLISETAYCRWKIRTRFYYPVSNIGRFNLGTSAGFASVEKFDKYPTSLRFFAGGDESVRGYKWKSLGPRDSNGDVEGGKHVFTASMEYDHMFLDKWVAAIFADAGNAFNDWPEKLYYGAGTGLRWLSPVGVVRLDCAWPMNRDNRGPKFSSLQLYFGFEINL